MKKLFLTALLSAIFIGSAYAQFRFGNYPVIGMVYTATNVANKDTLLVNFNTSLANSSYTATAVTLSKCQTQKGLQCIVYTDNTTTTSIQSGNFKCVSYGGNGNPVHVPNMDSLLHIMAKSSSILTLPSTPPTNGNLADSLTAPAHCLFDVTGGGQAYGVYPGKYKHLEYGFQVDLTSKACTDDITFEIDTYNAGTTGKTASYELAVYGSTTISDANLIGSKIANFYVTGSGKKSVNLATVLGKVPGDFSNKKICIFLRTQGTSNASGTIDGLPNATSGTTHIPVAYDPTIVFDNFNFMFGSASWIVPEGVIASTIFNHNNGSPVNLGVGATDFSGGTPVPVYITDSTRIPIYLTGINRIGTIDIKEANDGGGHSSKFGFTSTGAVLKKAADGTYSQKLTYTYTPSDGTTAMDLLIPAPTSGSVNDTIQVLLTSVGVTAGMTPAVRLEITNGIRFWYNVGVIGSLYTSVPAINLNSAFVWTENKSIFVSNTTEVVYITNLTGQKLKVVSPAEAAKGINLNSGIYIVKTGSFVQKVLLN